MHMQSECKFREYGECGYGCGKRLVYAQLNEHLLSECPLRKVECDGCKLSVVLSELETHAKFECVVRKLENNDLDGNLFLEKIIFRIQNKLCLLCQG